MGNVLIVGESGVGKSTLINAVLNREATETGAGISGTTKDLEIYEGEALPFRVIDTIGFEPSFMKKTQAINAVKKWSKESARKGKEEGDDRQIHVIWFCIEGTRRKLFAETIRSMLRATSMWKSIPIVVVITKSYSIVERRENVRMVHDAFRRYRQYDRLKDVIPVVASAYIIDDDNIVPPNGIDELIARTNELMPEAMRLSEEDVKAYILNRKRILAQGVVTAATVAGITATAIPVPIADALMLSSIEMAEIRAIAKVYGIKTDDRSQRFISAIVEVGTVSTAARAAISSLKAIPGINIAAGVLNAIIGGTFVTLLGEGSVVAFEQIYLGKKSVDDIDWIRKLMESKFANEFLVKMDKVVKSLPEKPGPKAIGKAIASAFTSDEN